MKPQPHDADFAASLADLANSVAPAFDIDTSGVIRTARRRREWRRSGMLAACGVVAFAGIGATQMWQPTTTAPPAEIRQVNQQPTEQLPTERGVPIAPAIEPLITNVDPAEQPVDPAETPTALYPYELISAPTNWTPPVALIVGLAAAGVAAMGTAGVFAARARKLA